eukprot:2576786-Pyramimonas_sp.AAC.1
MAGSGRGNDPSSCSGDCTVLVMCQPLYGRMRKEFRALQARRGGGRTRGSRALEELLDLLVGCRPVG